MHVAESPDFLCFMTVNFSGKPNPRVSDACWNVS